MQVRRSIHSVTWTLLVLGSVCSEDVASGSEPIGSEAQAASTLAVAATAPTCPNPSFYYLQCNATDWNTDAHSRMAPTANPNGFEIAYGVTQAWMTGPSGSDQCQIVKTTALDTTAGGATWIGRLGGHSRCASWRATRCSFSTRPIKSGIRRRARDFPSATRRPAPRSPSSISSAGR